MNVTSIGIALLGFVLLPASVQAQTAAGYPVWPLSSATGGIALDATEQHPLPQTLAGSSTTGGGTGIGFNCCGDTRLYAMHTGSAARFQLKLYDMNGLLPMVDQNGNPVTDYFDASRGDNEIQMVPVPDNCSQYLLIYNRPMPDTATSNGGVMGYNRPSEVLYSRIRYTGTGPVTVYEKDVYLTVSGASYSYLTGKAVSRKGQNNLEHYLYLCRRAYAVSTMSVDRFRITWSAPWIVFASNTGDIATPMDYMNVSGSSLELNADETLLAAGNRSEKWYSCSHPQIFLFPTGLYGAAAFTAANAQAVCLYECILKDVEGGTHTVFELANDQFLHHVYLQNFPRKISGLQFSPSGRFLWITGGGFEQNGYYNVTYLGQIDLLSNGGQMPLDLRLRMQHPGGTADGNTGRGALLSANNTDQMTIGIQSAYNANTYITKAHSQTLAAIPPGNNTNRIDGFLQTNLRSMATLNDPPLPSIDVAPAENIALAHDAVMMPDAIDGFRYTRSQGINVTSIPQTEGVQNGPAHVHVIAPGTVALTGNPTLNGHWNLWDGTIAQGATYTFQALAPGVYVLTYVASDPVSDSLCFPVVIYVDGVSTACHDMTFTAGADCEQEITFTNTNLNSYTLHDLHIVPVYPNANARPIPHFEVIALPPGWSQTNGATDRLDLHCPAGVAPGVLVTGIRVRVVPACSDILFQWSTSTHDPIAIDTLLCSGIDSLRCVLPCVNPGDSLVGWWPLGDVGTTVGEISHQPDHLNGSTSATGYVTSEGGIVGSSYNFWNGTVTVPSPLANPLNPAIDPFSIDCWIHAFSAPSAGGRFLSKMGAGTNPLGYALGMDPAGKIVLEIGDGSGISSYVSQSSFKGSRWYHLTVVLRRAPFSVRFYRDGLADGPALTTPALAPSVVLSNAEPFAFGTLETGTKAWYGNLDEVEFFRRALRQDTMDDEPGDLFEAGGCGKCPPADTICGMKYNDLNHNGVHDSNEPGLAGWNFTMMLDGDTAVLHATSDANGEFCFENLQSGHWILTEELQTGWTQSQPAGNGAYGVDIPVTGTPISYPFGNWNVPGNDDICGLKFFDIDQNQKPGANEPGLPGWTIILTPTGGGAPITTVTDAAGNYCFYDVPPGTYTLSEQQQPGWTQTAPPLNGSYTITVPLPVPLPQYSFGNVTDTMKIFGVKFNDLDGDGVRDLNEPGLQGWTITLQPSSGPSQQMQTDANGVFSFGNLTPGSYTVSETPQAGWTQTMPGGSGTYAVTIPLAFPYSSCLFGNHSDISGINGQKWHDVDGDGVKDPGEPGLQGWTIKLTPAGGGTPITVTTDATGAFQFQNVPPGTYTMSEVLPSMSTWMQTYPTGNGTYTVTLPLAQPETFLFGNTTRVCIRKMNDLNGNGFWDVNEPLLPGWTIILTPAGGGPAVTGVTDANGVVCFTGIPNGSYILSEVPQPGWTQTRPAGGGTITITVPMSPYKTFTFMNMRDTVSMCGIKYSDLDGDGQHDAGEPGLAGWHFTALLDGDTAVAHATSDADGEFCFTNLLPGQWILTEEPQPGWTQTQPGGTGSYMVTVPQAQPQIYAFGNRGSCDDVIEGASPPDWSSCRYTFTVASPLTSPVATIQMNITGGTLADLSFPGCSSFTPPLVNLITQTSALITFATACTPPIDGSIAVFPNAADGWVTVHFTITHADQTVCVDSVVWRCCPLTGPCDSLVGMPFYQHDLQHDSHRFAILNRTASPISYVEFFVTPPLTTGSGCSGWWTGGEGVDDGDPVYDFAYPFTRIPSTAPAVFPHGEQYVAFNIGIDWDCAWTGTFTFIVHHADGSICPIEYGPVVIDNPTGGKIIELVPHAQELHLISLRVSNTDRVRNMRFIGVAVEKPNQIFAVSAPASTSIPGDGDASMRMVRQSPTRAVFMLETPVPPGGSAKIRCIVRQDSDRTALHVSSFDEGGNLMAIDTASPVTSVEAPPHGAVPEDMALLGIFPNPATGTATINYLLGTGRDIRLEVYNELGAFIVLLHGGFMDGGVHSARCDTRALPAGTYYLRLSSGERQVTMPMVVVN